MNRYRLSCNKVIFQNYNTFLYLNYFLLTKWLSKWVYKENWFSREYCKYNDIRWKGMWKLSYLLFCLYSFEKKIESMFMFLFKQGHISIYKSYNIFLPYRKSLTSKGNKRKLYWKNLEIHNRINLFTLDAHTLYYILNNKK